MDSQNTSQLIITAPPPGRVPAIIAHRGASRDAPENTLPAIRRALGLGPQGIEFDVLLTADQIPVVTHNDDLSILTDGRGHIHSTPFATVRSLNAGKRFGPQTFGTTMPTLSEVLQVIGPHDVQAIVEIKAQAGLAETAASLIGNIALAFPMRGGIIVSSASIRILSALRRRHPSIPCALIVRNRAFSFFASTLFARLLRISEIHVSFGALTSGLVRRMHRRGKKVVVWTINTPDEFDRCLALDVDGCITDDVSEAQRHLRTLAGTATGPRQQHLS